MEATLAARNEVDPSGEILQLKQFCPWKEHLYELEEEHKVEPKIKYVLYEVRGYSFCLSGFTVHSSSFFFCVFWSIGMSFWFEGMCYRGREEEQKVEPEIPCI